MIYRLMYAIDRNTVVTQDYSTEATDIVQVTEEAFLKVEELEGAGATLRLVAFSVLLEGGMKDYGKPVSN